MTDDLHAYVRELEAALGRHTEELRRSRDLLRVVFDNLPEGLLLIDSAGALLAANQAFCRQIVGRRPQDVVGISYRRLWAELAASAELSIAVQGPSDECAPLVPPVDQPFGEHVADWRILCTDTMGQERWYIVERVPLGDGPGGGQWLERWRDVTRQEELQRRLLLHDQLASLGRLAASVAHEVGNPLQSAMSCLELCREDRSIPTAPREYLDLALGELERMARTMERLRHLYRPPHLTWESVDLNEVLRQVAQFTRRQLHRSHVQLDLVLEADLPLIVGQADALRQVFLNLILNAQEAMPHGGTVRVSSHRKETDRVCQIVVSDSGVGMSADQLAHLFEPFRSGKAQGVGLGLYLSRQIVEQHTGHIEAASHLGVGTIMMVLLPWSDAPPQRETDED
jgi:signal transduction histidine kinase